MEPLSYTRDVFGWTSARGSLLTLPSESRTNLAEFVPPLICNIEGDRLGYNALKMNPKSKFGNVITALDAPLSKGSRAHHTFQQVVDMKKGTDCKRLEAFLPDFDQTKVLLTELFWSVYYTELFSKNKSEDKVPLITFQVHQLPDETDKLNLYKRYLSHFYDSIIWTKDEDMYKNAIVTTANGEVNLHFKYGYDIDDNLKKESYQPTEVPAPNSDFALSFSMGIGYDPSIRPSDTVYPNKYLYLDIDNQVIWDYPKYREKPDLKIENDLINQMNLPDFISTKSRIVSKWIEIMQERDPFIPEGEGVITHDKIDPKLLDNYKVGPQAKIVGLWSPTMDGPHPIRYWE